MERLSTKVHGITVDWPGFGDLTRATQDCSVDGLSRFLDAFVAARRPTAVVAAGHAATYALQHAARHLGAIERLVLVAPTWRGPLPTMAGGHKPLFDRIVSAIDMPVVGQALYRVNVSRPVLQMMAREHVYEEPDWLSGKRFAEKRCVTRATGARHASARFVTGKLDPVDSRAGFLDVARRAAVPTLVIVGSGTPRKSLAEIEALASVRHVQIERFGRGRLAIHEEFPGDIAHGIMRFLAT